MEKITQYMSTIKKRIHSFMTEAFKSYNITGAEASFIKEIADRKFCKRSDLCKYFSCDKSHTHRIITKLFNKNIVQTAEQNQQVFQLTNYGQSIAKKINITIKEVTCRLKEGLTNNDIETIIKLLKICEENANRLKLEDINV